MVKSFEIIFKQNNLLFKNDHILSTSGVMIRQELDFQTRVCILASTLIPLETSATKKKHETMELCKMCDCFLEIL